MFIRGKEERNSETADGFRQGFHYFYDSAKGFDSLHYFCKVVDSLLHKSSFQGDCSGFQFTTFSGRMRGVLLHNITSTRLHMQNITLDNNTKYSRNLVLNLEFFNRFYIFFSIGKESNILKPTNRAMLIDKIMNKP